MKIHTSAQKEINKLKADLYYSLCHIAEYRQSRRNDFANGDEADLFQRMHDNEQKYADLLKKEIKFRQKKALSDARKKMEMKIEQLKYDNLLASAMQRNNALMN
ncbi:hypothetical protein [Shewanella frigidimarina]|uniref:hypothetical protein n=1 Tax=Shewanella frigidimarina TaxID=56812 RepID=UPI003D7B4CA6